MGTAFYRISDNAAGLADKIDSNPDGVVWIIGRIIARPDPLPPEIHLQGVSLDEIVAVAMCQDESYFVGPLPINVLLSHNPIPWNGLYFPLKK